MESAHMKPAFALTTILFTIACAIRPGEAAAPHPFHISLAEVEYNAESHKLEVALKVHAADLEQSLTLLADSKVDIDEDELGPLVEKFVDEYFYFLPAEVAEKIDQQSRSLTESDEPKLDFPRSQSEYIGKEFETTWVWLYLELELPETTEPLAVVDAVFLDRIEKQINTVTFRLDAKKQAIKLTRKSPWAPVPWLDEVLSRRKAPADPKASSTPKAAAKPPLSKP